MDAKKKDSFKLADLISTPQNQKYQILQKINSIKKISQDYVSPSYDHLDTFIVKRQSNKIYYIMKTYEVFLAQKITKEISIHSPSKNINFIKDIKTKILYHPNLISVEQAYFECHSISQKSSKYLVVIQQYCQQGDLAYFVRHETKKSLKQGRKETFGQKIISKWLLQILLALEHLHYNKSTHQFLNPNNLYLTPLGNLKLNHLYLINSVIGLKQIKRPKEQVTPLIQGYQPILNQKKFRINEKKDIFDFGILISYLCNSRIIRDSKKQVKNKNFCHLPSCYSPELDEIYLNCINVKKTGLQVKDILKTPYFLQVMKEFIIDKKLNNCLFQRIPIKKYNIHKQTLSPKHVRKLKKEERVDKQIIQVKLPKIDKKTKAVQAKQSVKINQKDHSKEQHIDSKKAIRFSLEKLKGKIQNHKQKLQKIRKNSLDKLKEHRQDQRKISKQKPKHPLPLPPCKQSNVKGLLPPPSLPKSKKTETKSQQGTESSQKEQQRSSREQRRSKSGQKLEPMSRSESCSPKKNAQRQGQYQLTPDITFGKKTHYNQKGSQNFHLQKQIVLKQQKLGILQGSKENQLEKISQNLAKIFSELKIREDDQEEVSFQLDEQEQGELRLTLKGTQKQLEGEEDLIKTYKSKFDQMICQLQEKYQPNMETIIEKTTQWDSSDFFVNQELLKRLRIKQQNNIVFQK